MNTVMYHNQEFSLEFDEYHTPLFISLWGNEGFAKEYERLTGVDVATFFLIRNNHNYGYMASDSSSRIYESLKTRLSKGWADQERAYFNRSIKELEQLVERIRATQNPSLKDLARDLSRVLDITSRVFPYSNAGYMLSFHLEKNILDKLQTIMPRTQAQKLLASSCSPIATTKIMRYRQDIKKIIAEVSELRDVMTFDDLVKMYTRGGRFKDLMSN